MARSSERTVFSTASASPYLPFSTSQRGDSGIRSMPKNKATAGSAQTANIKRQTPSTWPRVTPRIAFTTNADNWPTTIANSLRPVIDPRISYGASSARKTGTTADRLTEWYRLPRPALGGDEESVAASVLWLLKGDAGQRAIIAQAMGWRPAQEAAGAGWLAPYLALMQKDQYDAVRLIASRSAKTLPPFTREQ